MGLVWHERKTAHRVQVNMHTYIHTYIHDTYIHTYMHACIHAYMDPVSDATRASSDTRGKQGTGYRLTG